MRILQRLLLLPSLAAALLLATPEAGRAQPVSDGACAADVALAPAPASFTDLAANIAAARLAPGGGLTTAPDGYSRNDATAVAPRSLQEAADRAHALAVPYRVQEGPTCGLYALGMVMDFWNARDARNASPYVVDRDATRPGAATVAPTTRTRLFETARANGYFAESLRIVGKEGGMFVADDLGKLATKFGYSYRRIDRATAADVRAVVDRGHPALVGFDVDQDGLPTSVAGKRAHWGVVVGHFEFEGEEYFIAQHGWEAKRYLWSAKDLEASMGQIQPTLGPKVIEILPGT